ncbi:heme peroxidase, partial [Chytriomyces sp. MP71]
ISRADLVSFAGAVAVSNYGGNEIKWRPGRVDAVSAADAGAAFPAPTSSSEDPNILRSFFNNYPGFNDKDIVALMGSHNMGENCFCHFNKSGFNGPWSLNPYYLTNEYFQRLNNQIQSNGRVYQPITNVTLTPPFHDNTRYVDTSGQNNGQSNGLIMLPADIALTLDGNFKQLVQMFAQNQDQFQLHFQSAFQELLEYGL